LENTTISISSFTYIIAMIINKFKVIAVLLEIAAKN